MQEAGFFNDEFHLGCGDSFEISDDESVPDSMAATQGKKGGNRTAAKSAGLPLVTEGDKDLSANLAKYKKAMLNKRTVLKEVKDRLEEEKCTSCKSLVTLHVYIVLFVLVHPFLGLLACYHVTNRGTTCRLVKRRWVQLAAS